VCAGAGSNEDDISMKLMQIIEVNNILRQGIEKGLPIVNLMENWDFLQVRMHPRPFPPLYPIVAPRHRPSHPFITLRCCCLRLSLRDTLC
jgi:hypothetical protein